MNSDWRMTGNGAYTTPEGESSPEQRKINEQRGETAIEATEATKASVEAPVEVPAKTEDDLAYEKWLEQNETRTQEQYDDEYSNGSKARNINDETGKERTFGEWDVYNIQQGESSREFGDRTKERHAEEEKAGEREKLLNRVQEMYYEGKLTQEDYRKRVNTIMNAKKINRPVTEAPAAPVAEAPAAETSETPDEKPTEEKSDKVEPTTKESADPILKSDSTRTDEYLNSEEGKRERLYEGRYDLLSTLYDEQVRKGGITEEEATRKKEAALDAFIGQIDEARQDYLDRINNEASEEASSELPDVLDKPAEPDTETPPVDPSLVALETDIDAENELEQDAAAELDKDADAEEATLSEEEKAKAEDFKNRLKNLVEKFDDAKEQRIRELQEKLSDLRPELAELYAKNRRLFVSHKNQELFQNTQLEYAKLMDELLRLQTEKAYKKEQTEKWNKLSDEDITKAHDTVRKGLQAFKEAHPEATQAELDAEEERLKTEATSDLLGTKESRVKANTAFLDEYLKQQNALETATVEALDHGTIWRKFVHNVVANKKVKTALTVLGAAGLVATGVGVLAGGGALAVGFAGWSAVGTGAARGALSGAVMSREDSRKSAVHNLISKEDYTRRLGEIISVSDTGEVSSSTRNVAMFLMDRYDEANETDRSNNRKRTLIATGIGAVIGGALGGLQVTKAVQTEKTELGITGYEPTETEYHSAVDIESISHAKGKGTEKLFLELGGKSSQDYYQSGAHDMVREISAKWGFTEKSLGLTHPGHISDWPAASQGFARDIAEAWARNGLIPATATTTGGNAIYGPVTSFVTETVRDNVFSNFGKGAATVFAGGVASGIGGLAGTRNETSGNRTETPPAETPTRGAAEEEAEDIDDLFRVESDGDGAEVAEFAPVATNEATEEVVEETPSETTNEAERSPEAIENGIRSFFERNGINDDNVIRVLSNTTPYDDAHRAAYERVWSGFDDNTKNAIRTWFDGIQARIDNGSQIDYGQGLRTWLANADAASSEASVEAPAETSVSAEASATPEGESDEERNFVTGLEDLNRNIGGDANTMDLLSRPLGVGNADERAQFRSDAQTWFNSLTPENQQQIREYYERTLGDRDPGRSALWSVLRTFY